MAFKTPKLNKKLAEVSAVLPIEVVSELEPVVRVGQILGSRAKAASQYDGYRFSKENPNPNWV